MDITYVDTTIRKIKNTRKVTCRLESLFSVSGNIVTQKWYGTAQFKLDTHVQQTRVHLTDFVEAHPSCSHAGCMAREHMHDRIYCPRTIIHSIRHARATPRGMPEAYRTQTDALAWLMHGMKWKGLALSYIQC